MKDKLISAKNHVVRNRGKYAFASGFVACFAITQHARNEWNGFLKEKGLYDEYYAFDE